MDALRPSHPSEQSLILYGTRTLDGPSNDEVEKHLRGCADCMRRAAELCSSGSLGHLRDTVHSTAGGPNQTSPEEMIRTNDVAVSNDRSLADSVTPEMIEFPDYEIVRELGRGGMGVVYLAHNRAHGPRRGAQGHRPAHHRAARACSTAFSARSAPSPGSSTPISSPPTPPSAAARALFSPWSTSRASTWPGWSRPRGRCRSRHACYFVHQAALGLQHAHEAGMVHRDIKPSNLMLTHRQGKAVIKVLDFGLAKAAASKTAQVAIAATRPASARRDTAG